MTERNRSVLQNWLLAYCYLHLLFFAVLGAKKEEKEKQTHPWDTIRSHQPKDISLNPLVQFHSRLNLSSLERRIAIGSKRSFGVFLIDCLHVRDEFRSEIVVDIEFTWGCWSEVG
jgi:hypothetical protein